MILFLSLITLLFSTQRYGKTLRGHVKRPPDNRKISFQNSILNSGIPLNEISIKQLVYQQPSVDHHYKGVDPEQMKLPYFNFNALNKIEDDHFYLEVNSSIHFAELELKTISNNKKRAHYKVYVQVRKDEDMIIKKDHKEIMVNLKEEYLTDILYESSNQKFRFNLDPGEYTIEVKIEDLNNSNSYFKKTEFKLKDGFETDFLISDIQFFDIVDGYESEIISDENNFGNRDDKLRIQFQSFLKDLNNKVTLGLEIRKELMVIEKLEKFLSSVLDIVTLSSFYAEEDTIFPPFYNYSWEKIRTEKFQTHSIVIDKSIFSEIEFEKIRDAKRYLLAEITRFDHKTVTKDIDDFDDIDVKRLDTLDVAKFNFNDAIGDEGEEVTIETKAIHSNRFMFQWEFVPQTADEIEYALNQMRYLLSDDTINKYTLNSEKDISGKYLLNLKKAQHFYSTFWITYASERNLIHPYQASQTYYRRLDFCNDNFPDIISIDTHRAQGGVETGQIEKGLRHKSLNLGWASDKAKVYLEFGLPDEIFGNNIFNKHGEMIQYHTETPIQMWHYKKQKRKYYFAENMLITSE